MVTRIGLRHDVVRMFRELTPVWSGKKRGYVVKSWALFTLILHRLSDIISEGDGTYIGDTRVSRVMRYIGAHYGEKITVKALARRVDLNATYLGTLFRRETGMTVHQHMTRVRLQNAEKLLQSGKHEVEKTAELCGFSDYFHFFKAFKALRGFPPSRCLPRK